MQGWGLHTSVSTPLTSAHMRVPAEGNEVLREIFELLEDYAPIWYTEELQKRVAAALGELQPAN